MATLDPGANIYNTSVVPPPIGQESNFDRPLSDVQLATITVFAVTYFLATVSLALRYATSVLVVKEWELDVVLITLAWGAALGYFTSVCFMMKYGWGSHAWDVSLADMVQYNKYLRSSRSWPCNPKDVGSGVCLNNLAISQVVLNIATDLSIIILPLPTLHNLKIPFRQKVVVGCILSIGSAVLIASIVRAPYVHIMATNPDFTRKQAEAGVWSLVEPNMGIVCNNLMRLKPFLRTYLPRVLTFLGLTAKSKHQGDSPSKSSGNWRARPSHSYQLNSLEHEDPHHKRFRKEPSVEEAAFGDLDKEASRHNGSTDDILRS
ncbi:uncharacterized protein FPRO_08623 [Fusarium proliferatum ET1]|uniref:Related to integral membrane protein n=1 Tax=Fusarium proliferatum (strain ET1) TaxID=1227346 RepID=A0A1L7W3M6_FUSPR|nr:uncharacterized protein FPRO_08623 [Fusarium proliferatum ET1]CZR47249.1 related to integral membrane protein [Fusarium proliferatum ET1]